MSSQKVIRKTSRVILIITLVNLYSFYIYYINTQDDSNLGLLHRAIKVFSRLPEHIGEVVTGLSEDVKAEEDAAFHIENNLPYDLYALNGNYVGSAWDINLTNLKNDSLIKKWTIAEETFVKTERHFSRTEPLMPIIMPDKSLIFSLAESNNLYRIDENSNILWHNTDHQYHHTVNLDADSTNIWALSRKRIYLKEQNIHYWQNGIVKINAKTGKTVMHQIMYDVFYHNNLEYLFHGSSNAVNRLGHDPLHMNDIEPVLVDGPYWKKGDLLLSFRNKSLIVLYRPETKKILRVIRGPFFNQHDVDILNDSTISLFNNNVTALRKIDNFTSLSEGDFSVNDSLNINMVSGVLTYNFNDSTFNFVMPRKFEEEKIYTETEGTHHFTANGDLFIESQNDGKIFIINENDVLLRDYMNPPRGGEVELSHWVRIYEDINFINQ